MFKFARCLNGRGGGGVGGGGYSLPTEEEEKKRKRKKSEPSNQPNVPAIHRVYITQADR